MFYENDKSELIDKIGIPLESGLEYFLTTPCLS